MKSNDGWAREHNDVIQKILRKARKGTRIVVMPGNHDEGLHQLLGYRFGTVEVSAEAVHVTADGRRLLVMHGDQFDGVVRYARWLVEFRGTSSLLSLWSRSTIRARRAMARPGRRSLAKYVKVRFKHAIDFVGRFERALADEASRRGFDGVVCGHVHHATDKSVGGVRYLNCGDWVDSCTALAEDETGKMHLLRCSEPSNVVELASARERARGTWLPVPALKAARERMARTSSAS